MVYVGSVVLFSSIHDEIDRGARDANRAARTCRLIVVFANLRCISFLRMKYVPIIVARSP